MKTEEEKHCRDYKKNKESEHVRRNWERDVM